LNGLPVVKAARGEASGLVKVNPNNLFIERNNLTTKARFLLTGAIMKLGLLPRVADPECPTVQETEAIKKKISQYQEILQAHHCTLCQNRNRMDP
jgi:hypothetical protein